MTRVYEVSTRRGDWRDVDVGLNDMYGRGVCSLFGVERASIECLGEFR